MMPESTQFLIIVQTAEDIYLMWVNPPQSKRGLDNHERWFCWERNRQGNIWFAVLYTPTWSADQRRSLESAIRQQYWIPCGER